MDRILIVIVVICLLIGSGVGFVFGRYLFPLETHRPIANEAIISINGWNWTASYTSEVTGMIEPEVHVSGNGLRWINLTRPREGGSWIISVTSKDVPPPDPFVCCYNLSVTIRVIYTLDEQPVASSWSIAEGEEEVTLNCIVT